uniref:Uncharacterized protein n=1 Tax=Leersia perrieri TaxID=77586 RepID=A0A0D9VTV5_9ORYZ
MASKAAAVVLAAITIATAACAVASAQGRLVVTGVVPCSTGALIDAATSPAFPGTYSNLLHSTHTDMSLKLYPAVRRRRGGGRDDEPERVVHDGGGRGVGGGGGAGGRLRAGGGHAAGQVRREAAGGGEAGVLRAAAGPARQADRRRTPPRARRLLLSHGRLTDRSIDRAGCVA